MYFYELHEGDDELFSDVLLAREEEMPADDFFELVQGVRRQVQGHHEEDTLIEAIAVELERSYAFLFVSDERISAAVNVSKDEDENFLIATDDELGALGRRVESCPIDEFGRFLVLLAAFRHFDLLQLVSPVAPGSTSPWRGVDVRRTRGRSAPG